ncbi:MAG: class I SAM-dependent methyltransferase [Gemmatimonadaceae bacterium]|nr:class I SAM-dependent methyltransferase [Gemmatimonadaceae bacterium]
MSDAPAPFKDHFSGHAAAYAGHRPRYPAALFEYLASVAPGRARALDCATGNGQAAVGLAAYFDAVIATDASAQQIAHAEPHPRVVYRVARAEDSAVDTHSVDLVTIAQALHWLDHAAFYAEVRRVLRPGGVLAAWCYMHMEIAPEVDAVVRSYYEDTVGGDWPPERRLIEEGYRTIPFPFTELEPPPFAMTTQWTRQQVMGYLSTWSATRAYQARTGRDPLPDVERALAAHWPDAHEARLVRWPLALRVGR